MKAEDLGAIVANHEPLQLLLVYREGAGFDVEVASSGEAKHVLTLGVPGHTIGIWFLRDKGLLGSGTLPPPSYSLSCTEVLTAG